MELTVGTRVQIKDYADIPQEQKARSIGNDPHLWNSGKAKTCGKTGTIVDCLYSRSYECDVYRVQFDGDDQPSRSIFDADAFVEEEAYEPNFEFVIDIADNVVIAIMLKDNKQIARGHGHIIHDGEIGYAQAASYAMRRCYEFLNGGSMIGGEYRGR